MSATLNLRDDQAASDFPQLKENYSNLLVAVKFLQVSAET
jgi:hypothetical protein